MQSPINWSDSVGLFQFNAELMWGAAAGADIKLFGKDVASAFVDLGTNHSPLFGDNYVTQGAGLQILFGEAYFERKAKGQTCGYKKDPLGRIIPGTARSANDVLSDTKFDRDITPFNKGWFSANLDDISIEAQFIIGVKVTLDVSKEWEYFKTNFVEQEGYFMP